MTERIERLELESRLCGANLESVVLSVFWR